MAPPACGRPCCLNVSFHETQGLVGRIECISGKGLFLTECISSIFELKCKTDDRMSLELASTSTSTEKTEISLFKLFCKHQPPSWDGSLYHVDLDIGRDLSCDIRIQYDGDGSKLFMLISKKHTTIRLSYKGVFVKDSNSKNGTFVGNTMVDAESWHELQERDHISLGWYVGMIMWYSSD